MDDFSGKVAVITGAASGIGLALAKRAVEEGMRLVLADIDGERLEAAAAASPLVEAERVLVSLDVSQEADVRRLAATAFDRYGEVHLLFNNAGVALARPIWEYSLADWEWVMGVNLWSVVHAVRHFVPKMLAQRSESHVVNTASVAGLLSTPGLGAYNVSKHGVVTLSETLHADLEHAGGKVGVSVLCPAWVPTGIDQWDRHRPSRYGAGSPLSEAAAELNARVEHAIRSGRLSAEDMATATFDAIRRRRFYVIPHGKIGGAIRERMEAMLSACAPAAPVA